MSKTIKKLPKAKARVTSNDSIIGWLVSLQLLKYYLYIKIFDVKREGGTKPHFFS